MSRALSLVTLSLVACGGQPVPMPTEVSTPESRCRSVHRVPGPTVPVRLRFPDDLASRSDRRLVISRLDADTARAVPDEGRIPLAAVMPFIRWSQAFEIVPGAGDVVCPYAMSDAMSDAMGHGMDDISGAMDAIPVAFNGFGDDFWSALLGFGGRELVGAGDGAGVIEMTGFGGLSGAGGGGGPKHCEGERFVHLTFEEHDFHACALLPKDHDPKQRLPVVYMLSGLAGDDTNRFGWSGFVDMVDAIAAESGRGTIYIGVDSRAPMGSIYPTEARTKAWLDWVAYDLSAAAQGKLGASHSEDALIGQSTGGFNAVSVGLLRPGAFRVIAASAPDALDLEAWLLDGQRVRPEWLAWMRLEDGVGGAGQMVSYAAAWSPDGKAMPADLHTGALRKDVLDAWLAHSPLRLLDSARGQDALRRLEGRLYIAVADNDDFGLAPPARRFAAKLDALGIAHHLLIDDHGHFGLDARLPSLMRAVVGDLMK